MIIWIVLQNKNLLNYFRIIDFEIFNNSWSSCIDISKIFLKNLYRSVQCKQRDTYFLDDIIFFWLPYLEIIFHFLFPFIVIYLCLVLWEFSFGYQSLLELKSSLPFCFKSIWMDYILQVGRIHTLSTFAFPRNTFA